MKKIFFSILAGNLFLLTFPVNHALGSINTPVLIAARENVIIQVPLSGDKTHTLIVQALTAYPGVTYVGKCLDQNMYFIIVDRSVQPGNGFIEDIFRNLSLEHFIKTGTPMEKAISDCNNMVDKVVAPIEIERP
ncbi:MAG TPA: hypothetical protein VF868_08370 [Bacteroidia bacterium]|jgi:hypothetical protein